MIRISTAAYIAIALHFARKIVSRADARRPMTPRQFREQVYSSLMVPKSRMEPDLGCLQNLPAGIIRKTPDLSKMYPPEIKIYSDIYAKPENALLGYRKAK